MGLRDVTLSDPPARLLSPLGPPIGVALPPLPVDVVAASADGFRVQLHDPIAPRGFRMVAVALDGTVTAAGARWAGAAGTIHQVDMNALLGPDF
ncbi:hypothetical protein [Rhodococcus sp. NPDC127528]|uniref:hypothetical protein n=1 Tax=unclassified Rhodococcus (in: high G+C Gram-positive bacteria) TaxID=192944 RepID=UPI003629DDB6